VIDSRLRRDGSRHVQSCTTVLKAGRERERERERERGGERERMKDAGKYKDGYGGSIDARGALLA